MFIALSDVVYGQSGVFHSLEYCSNCSLECCWVWQKVRWLCRVTKDWVLTAWNTIKWHDSHGGFKRPITGMRVNKPKYSYSLFCFNWSIVVKNIWPKCSVHSTTLSAVVYGQSRVFTALSAVVWPKTEWLQLGI